ncbi:Uncharacterised protein [Salmonella enterica subsp. enterica]|uniref:Uncharacterized protein n=1 Tax=Salmonella enterica I TaxID=59201 RepID=A0A447TNI6_SALET|nr:Uncharacterised protein [Salmonella enterica subsp. enterica]
MTLTFICRILLWIEVSRFVNAQQTWKMPSNNYYPLP